MTHCKFDTGDAHSPSPSEALVEEIARVIWKAHGEYDADALMGYADFVARAVLAARPIVELVEALNDVCGDLQRIADHMPGTPGLHGGEDYKRCVESAASIARAALVDVRAALLPFSQRETGTVSEIEIVDAARSTGAAAIACGDEGGE